MKITKPHLKKLEDRSKALVHLGTEPGTKAYRLLDPTTRRIVVSRDVVFNEDQRWKWLETTKKEHNDFVVIDFGDVETSQENRENRVVKEEDTEVKT